MDSSSSNGQQVDSRVRFHTWVIFVVLAFGVGIFVGRKQIAGSSPLSASSTSGIINVVNQDRLESHAKSVEFNQFWQIWDRIEKKFVHQPVKESDIFYGALQGMVAGLGDPYSTFFPPKAASEFIKSLSGEFSGIGAEIGIKNGDLVVVAPLPSSPAEQAGLRPGDKIVAIDALPTAGMDVNTAVMHIRGPAGTTTTLFIARDGVSKGKEYIIKRANINVPAIIMKILPGNVAHIRIMQFNDRTMPEFLNSINEIKRKPVAGLIIDLRNNPGGLLDSAVSMASQWIENGIIVKEKLFDGSERVHETEGDHPLTKYKTVVLINGGSASASEIVAGALHDHNKATIIGEKSFGKGSVQDLEEFSDGSSLKLTIAEWFTPNGVNINQKGIVPDIEVKEDFEKEKIGEDVMIKKALELLIGASTTASL